MVLIKKRPPKDGNASINVHNYISNAAIAKRAIFIYRSTELYLFVLKNFVCL